MVGVAIGAGVKDASMGAAGVGVEESGSADTDGGGVGAAVGVTSVAIPATVPSEVLSAVLALRTETACHAKVISVGAD